MAGELSTGAAMAGTAIWGLGFRVWGSMKAERLSMEGFASNSPFSGLL